MYVAGGLVFLPSSSRRPKLYVSTIRWREICCKIEALILKPLFHFSPLNIFSLARKKKLMLAFRMTPG